MNLVLLYGYQSADADAEQLALTEQLCAALGELGVVARRQPCLTVGDFNVEPTKVHCLSARISAGLWPGRELMESSLLSPVSVPGIPLVVIGGILWFVALLLLLRCLLVRLNLAGGSHSILR